MIASPSASDALKVPITTPVTFSDAVFELKVKPVGALLALTVILNVSFTEALPLSVAITLTAIVPISDVVGVPVKVRVEALKESHEGKRRSIRESSGVG